jgi:hypothetical protein
MGNAIEAVPRGSASVASRVRLMSRLAKITSFLVGTAAALILVAAWRVPPGAAEPPARLRVAARASPAVQLSRTGLVIDAAQLRPGDARATSLAVTNVLATPLRVRARAELRAADPLAGAIRLRLLRDAEPLFNGPLPRLTGRVARRFSLQPGEQTTISVRIVLPAEGRGVGGRVTDVELVFEVEP